MSSRSGARAPRRSATSSKTRVSSNTSSSRSTGPYNRNFQQNLIDGAVYPPSYRFPNRQPSKKPDNWDEIMQRLARPRPSLSPSRFTNEDYERFVQADADAAKEKQLSTSVIPIIEGTVGDAKCVSGGIPFNNLDHLTDGTLAPGNPDIYYGARPEQLDRQVRDELCGLIIPSTQKDLPICLNFFVAAKGPDGSLAVATRQATYDGALGARGMHSIKSYGESDALYDNNAYTITSIYHGGQLKMFTSHCQQPNGTTNKRGYFTNQLNTWGLTGNIETCRQGVTAYRNGKEWTTEQRDNAIRHANTKVNKERSLAPSLDVSFSSLTSESTVRDDFRLSQETPIWLDELSTTTPDLQDSEAPSQESISNGQKKRRHVCSSDSENDRRLEERSSGISELG